MRRDAPPVDTRSWYGVVVDHLVQLRTGGSDFSEAWRQTMRLHPPRGSIADVTRLFDETGEKPETLLAFFRRACESAYHLERGEEGSGIGPALREFRAGMVRSLDESAPARPVGRGSRAFRSAA